MTVFTPDVEAAIRPAKRSELSYVLDGLKDAVGNNAHYGALFKAHELARLDWSFLEAIQAADPCHVALCLRSGKPVGFILTGPELGNLWLYWAYIEPSARRSDAFIAGMRAVICHFDHGRFHKISTYTRPGNKAPAAVIERLGYRRIALLENHIFGEDYYLFERKLTKALPGYDNGAAFGRAAAIKRRLTGWLRPGAA